MAFNDRSAVSYIINNIFGEFFNQNAMESGCRAKGEFRFIFSTRFTLLRLKSIRVLRDGSQVIHVNESVVNFNKLSHDKIV